MLDGGGDDLLALGLRLQCGKDRGGIRFGAAGGEDDLGIVFRAEQLLHLHARFLDGEADLVAEAVHRRGIAELLGEIRQHGFHHRGIDPRGRVVVEIDAVPFVAPCSSLARSG